MTNKTKDKCPFCDRNGLSISEKGGKSRRRCALCYRDEPRPQDRVCYLACSSDVLYVDGKGKFLTGSWDATPFFDEADAKAYLAENYKEYETRPETVQGHVGLVAHTNGGPQFYFVWHRLVDCAPILDPKGVR